MAPTGPIDVLFGLAGVVWLFGLMLFVFMVVFWPLMAFSAMRNVKKIRLELERLNEILESRLSADPLGGIKR